MPQSECDTITVLDPDYAEKAVEVAKKFAEQTGHNVTVQDSDGAEIETVRPTRH